MREFFPIKSIQARVSDLLFERESIAEKSGIPATVVAILIIAAAFIAHLSLLAESPFPPGSDGYVFLVQARSLLEGKGLHYHDPSLFYLILTPLTAIMNPVTALKVSVAFVSSLLAVGIFLLARSDGRTLPEQICVAAWSAFSPACFFFCAQYPKQFLGIALFIFFLQSLRSRRIVYAIIFLVSATLSHRFSAALALLFIVPYFLRRHGKRKMFRAFALAGIVMLVIAAIIATVPGTLSFRDIARFQFNRFNAPVLPLVSFAKSGLGLHPLILADAAVSLLVIMYAFIVIARGKKRLPAWTVSLFVSVLILSVPLFSFADGGAGYRLYLATFPLSAALLAGTGLRGGRFSIIATIAILAAGTIHAASDHFRRYDPPYDLYAGIASKTGALIPGDAILVVAHRPLAETIDYALHIDTLAWRPETGFDRARTWRIARDIERWEITRAGGIPDNDSRIRELSARYILVREDLWDAFLAALPRDNEDLVFRAEGAFNPSAVRPPFITGR